jgi:hypothetical protein
MQHPALIQALAAAHIEDLQRAAARRHTIRLMSICRRCRLGATAGTDRASSEARRASSLTPEEAPMSSVYRRRSGARVTGFTRDRVHPLGLAPDQHGLGALAGELDCCCTSFPRVAPVITTTPLGQNVPLVARGVPRYSLTISAAKRRSDGELRHPL